MTQIIVSVILILITMVLLFVLVVGAFYFLDLFMELPYVATKKEKLKTIISFASSGGSLKGKTIVDLGSGDGRLLFAAAQKGAFAIGYELNPFLISLTVFRANLKGVRDRIQIYKKDLWAADLKTADVVFVYGRKKTMKKFEDFVFNNTRKNTRIVVNTNPFPTKRHKKLKENIYLYIT